MSRMSGQSLTNYNLCCYVCNTEDLSYTTLTKEFIKTFIMNIVYDLEYIFHLLETTHLMSQSGRSVDERSSQVAVHVGVQCQGLVLVLSLQDAGLGSVKKLLTSR